MLKWETVRDLFSIVLVLLFLPSENRAIIGNTRPEDWYGEFYFTSSKEVFVIAKNSGSEEVTANLGAIKSALARNLGDPSDLLVKQVEAVPGESYSLIVVDGSALSIDIKGRLVKGSGGRLFVPGPLAISTRSDSYAALGLVGIVVVCFVFLSYSIGVYICERSAASQDKAPKPE